MARHENPWDTTCPRCGRESGLVLLAEATGKQDLQATWSDAGVQRVGRGYEQAGLYVCPTCKGFTLRTLLLPAEGFGEGLPLEGIPLGTAIPKEGLPPEVGADRDDAWRAFHGRLFKGAALLGRSSLEAAVKKLGATGQDLKAKIKNLADQGAITQDLAAWATEVRITGNEAAHEMGPVSEEDAKDGLFFLDAFLDAVYVVPHRHRERKAQREAKAAQTQDDQGPTPTEGERTLSRGPPVFE